MRANRAFLIFRTFTQFRVIALLLVLAAAGFVVRSLGVDKKSDPVCIGEKEYDLDDPDDREEIQKTVVDLQQVPSKLLTRPPCDLFGSPVRGASLEKVFSHDFSKKPG